MFGTKKFVLVLKPKRIFFAIKKNIFLSNVRFFTLKIHFLKVKTLLFDLDKIVLFENTFSLRL